jgi:hypothetical protein
MDNFRVFCNRAEKVIDDVGQQAPLIKIPAKRGFFRNGG